MYTYVASSLIVISVSASLTEGHYTSLQHGVWMSFYTSSMVHWGTYNSIMASITNQDTNHIPTYWASNNYKMPNCDIGI